MVPRIHRRQFLRTAAGAASMMLSRGVTGAPGGKKPNVILMVIDDMGWADAGCYGSRFHETPNIDALAEQGMRFTDGYAACPVCSPTRASIMTGKYPARLHLTDFLVGRRKRIDSPVLPVEYVHQLPLEEVTVAEALKGAGYRTCHIGKWHLGGEPYWPQHQGFDVNIAGCQSGMPRSFFWPQWKGNPPIAGREDGEYLPDRLADEAVQFIESSQDQPFFLYLAHYAVHIPIEAKQAAIERFKNKPKPEGFQNNPIYAAMIESIDQSLGKVMDTLKRLGIDDNTVVAFTSDNGGLSVQEGKHTPATSNAPLRGGKGYLYEGGIREPYIVKWPGVTEPGSTCDEPVCSVDFLPTVAEIAGLQRVDTNGPIDGESIVPLLSRSGGLKRDALYWHYPHFSNQGGRPGGVIREGKFKLIERYEDGSLELYDLNRDISETRNLAVSMPDRATRLRQRLDDWRQSVDASMPPPNPDYVKR